MSLKKEHEVEVIKAVAQAWLGHSSGPKATNEFDAHRRNFKNKPSRFKLEALNKYNNNGWDFRESLLDSYEIVTLSRKLETGLMLDYHQPSRQGSRKEKKNSLRSLFNNMSSSSSSSRSFNVDNLPWENGG